MCLPAFHIIISSNKKILETLSFWGLRIKYGLKGCVAYMIQVVCDFFAAKHYESLSGISAVDSYELI
jgi:hypothetical protein